MIRKSLIAEQMANKLGALVLLVSQGSTIGAANNKIAITEPVSTTFSKEPTGH